MRSSSGSGTDDCGRTSGPSRPSTMPSPPSTRPSGARGRRSFVFVREDGETATDSALLVGHHRRLARRDQFATMVAFAIWLISLTLEAPRADGARPPGARLPRVNPAADVRRARQLPPSRPSDVKASPRLSRWGFCFDPPGGVLLRLQLKVEAASPVPRRRVYAPVHVQLLENVVDMVLHRCQLDDETASAPLVGDAVIDYVQNCAFATRHRPHGTLRVLRLFVSR